jgi:aminopeptidase N
MSGLATEPDVGVVQTILRHAQAAVDQYAAPEHRDAYNDRLADMLWRSAGDASSGTDHQLAFTRAFAAEARGQALDKVAGLLDGSIVLPGLAVDTDLRWSLVLALAAGGRDAGALIADEAARDATAAGQRHAATAMAARPTEDAKSEAWAAIMTDHKLPNAVLDAKMAGFARPGQEDLLRPYRARYFESLADIWRARTPEMAQAVTVFLYPYLLVEPETIAAADACLQDPGLHPAARRLVSEGRDGTERAMRARRRDSAS